LTHGPDGATAPPYEKRWGNRTKKEAGKERGCSKRKGAAQSSGAERKKKKKKKTTVCKVWHKGWGRA